MKPIIYQVLPRYWGAYQSRNVRGGSLEDNRCGHFGDFDAASLDYFKSLGCTHVWYTGVLRHATLCEGAGCTPSHPQFVKGAAGSPYAITDYYDVNPYLAENPDKRMQEFDALVERTHAHGMKVLLDFVPNHVSRDNVNFGRDDDISEHWKAENDFFYYPDRTLYLPTPFVPTQRFPSPYMERPARATGNNCFDPCPGINDWYETVKLNYCTWHTGTWDKMLDILLFWLDRGVDGFRCDMVELVPEEFLTWLISGVKRRHPDCLFIAEVYQKEKYRKYLREVGFDYLYDKSGLYDALHDIVMKNTDDDGTPSELWQSTRRITSNWQFLGDLQPQMLNFIENHDEVRAASRFLAGNPSATLAAAAVSALLNTAPFMLYCGQEVGEDAPESEGFSGDDGRSTIFDWWKSRSASALWEYVHSGKGLDNAQRLTLRKYSELLKAAAMPQFAEGEVYDLCFCNYDSPGFDADRHFAFLRYDNDAAWLVMCNFSPIPATADLEIRPFGVRRKVHADAYGFSITKLEDTGE